MNETSRFGDPSRAAQFTQLFRPGSGATPPALAGREAEAAVFNELLGNLTGVGGEVRSAPRDLILYGPRGNGKTCLMEKCRREAVRQGIDALDLRPGQVETPEKLARQLLFNDDKALWTLLKKGAPASLKLGLPTLAEAEWRALPPAEKAQLCADHLVPLLAARCAAAPLLVAVDEAHTLDPEAGRTLLNVSEQVRKQGLPFLLILAGTPNLKSHLARMDSSFWGRSAKLAIGRLSVDATSAALTEPLAGLGIGFDPGTLAGVVDDSQCYPYFIQLWGKALCDCLVAGQGDTVTADMMAEAQVAVDAERSEYYGDRCEEMKKAGLLDAAAVLAAAFREHDTQYDSVLDLSLAEALHVEEAEASDLVGRLSDLGYLWRPGGSLEYEPGIPSLMTHVSEVVEARRRAVARRTSTAEGSLPLPPA